MTRRLTLVQSVSMLVSALMAWTLRDARIAAAVGAVSLGVFVMLNRGKYTERGSFGAANATTSVRAGFILVLASVHSLGPPAAVLGVACLVLDGVDGWLARRPPVTASPFGARFDMETDALFVLVLGLKLAEVGRLGAFIVLPGLLRYAYVGVVALCRLPEAPRSRFGRLVAGALMWSLVASAWPVAGVHRSLALLASVLVGLSFARSLAQSIRLAPGAPIPPVRGIRERS